MFPHVHSGDEYYDFFHGPEDEDCDEYLHWFDPWVNDTDGVLASQWDEGIDDFFSSVTDSQVAALCVYAFKKCLHLYTPM